MPALQAGSSTTGGSCEATRVFVDPSEPIGVAHCRSRRWRERKEEEQERPETPHGAAQRSPHRHRGYSGEGADEGPMGRSAPNARPYRQSSLPPLTLIVAPKG